MRYKIFDFLGLLKTEAKITTGNFYALSPKCYVMDGETRKISHKGVPKSVKLHHMDFRDCLYGNKEKTIKFNHIAISRRHSQATTKEVEKRALNGLYYKMFLEANKISTRPHMKDGKFV